MIKLVIFVFLYENEFFVNMLFMFLILLKDENINFFDIDFFDSLKIFMVERRINFVYFILYVL